MEKIMKPEKPVGIVGYGAYVPRYRIEDAEIRRMWYGGKGGVPIKEKAVPGLDEDTITIAIEAGRNALARAQVPPEEIKAVWVGSESHPYAVKPSSTIVAEALGISPLTLAGDWEFACKAGTEAMQASLGLVGSGMAKYALAIGADTAQGRPADPLEYTAAAGGAAFIIGTAEESLAVLEASVSYATDTPDFWRRPFEHYPSHGHRFTGEPAYFHHITSATKILMEELGRKPEDYRYVVFHQPNVKFPQRVGKMLGFKPEQIETGLLSGVIGNTYSGASMVGMTAILDEADPGDRVLMVSFGSGAGSDAFSWIVTEKLPSVRKLAPFTKDYISRRKAVDYATYARFRHKILR